MAQEQRQRQRFGTKMPDGTVLMYEFPETEEEKKALLARLAEDEKRHTPAPEKELAGLFDPYEPDKQRPFDPSRIMDWLRVAGEATSLLGGLGGAPLATRMMRTGLGGAMTGASMGGSSSTSPEQRLRQAATGFLGEAALEGGFGKLAELLPRGGVRAGLTLGGARGDTDSVVEAFMRERARSRPFSSIPLGAQSRNVPKPPTSGGGVLGPPKRVLDTIKQRQNVQRRIDVQGKKLEDIERGSTITTPLSSLMGASRKAKSDALAGPEGLKTAANLQGAENVFLQDQAAIKKLRDLDWDPAAMTEQQLHQAMRGARLARPANFGQTQLSMRDLGEIRRASGKGAEPIIRKRQLKERFDPQEDAPGAAAEAIHSRAKETQDMLLPEITPVNQRLSDLFTIREANEVLRGGGGVVSDLGQMATRGGLAHGVAQSIGRVTQAPAGPLRGLLNTFGLALLAPSMVSKGGYAAGTTAGLIPTAGRLFGNPVSDTDFKALIEAMLEPSDDEKYGDERGRGMMRGVRMRKP